MLNTFLRSFFLSECEILTGVLAKTKLLGFRLLWDVTAYVIGRGKGPTNIDRRFDVSGKQHKH
jgi:hypothetical protein